jgi:gamma-glutamyl hydrolase
VHWLESAGGRLVPVPFDAHISELEQLFFQINGLVFTGGSLLYSANTSYFQKVEFLFNLAKQVKDEGDYFPSTKISVLVY